MQRKGYMLYPFIWARWKHSRGRQGAQLMLGSTVESPAGPWVRGVAVASPAGIVCEQTIVLCEEAKRKLSLLLP